LAYKDLSIDLGRTNFRQKRDMECKLGLRALLEPAINPGSYSQSPLEKSPVSLSRQSVGMIEMNMNDLILIV